MAIYHFSVKVHSRATGRNAVAGATYRHGQSMIDERSGKVFTNATHQDVEHCELSIPENSPKWVQELLVGDVHKNSEKLWNAVEQFEKRVDAQVYRDIEFSLPHELSSEQRLELAREFIKDNFTSRGMIADWCIHNHFDEIEEIEKPHVHVMLTMREAVEKDATILQKLKSYIGLERASSEMVFGPKVVEWNSKILLCNWREKWADYANAHLAKAGLDIRIDHRSYKEQGIELIPQPKLGKSVNEMRCRGEYVDRFLEVKAVQEKNKELIRENPSIVLDYITRYQSTFTRQDIAKVLNRYIDDAKEFQLILGQIEASEQLVTLSANEQGEALKLTTKDMIRVEKQIVEMAVERAAFKPSCSSSLSSASLSLPSLPFPSPSSIELSLNKGHEKLKEHGGLSADQVHAIEHMVSDGQLKVIVGYAGAGKTTCLDIAQEIWKESGYRVVGAAPTGKAASNLMSIGIASKTLHKWEQEWNRDRELLNKNTVLILDEAGMVDSQKLHFLLRHSQEQGFKLVLVGDPEQLPPIEAGAPTRAIMEAVGFAELSTIVRQKVDWQREASQQLATHQTEKALETYHQNNSIHYSNDVKDQLIQDWMDHVKINTIEKLNHPEYPVSTSLILAHTNQDVKELNTLARQEMQKEGLLDDYNYRFTISKPLNLETLDQEEIDSSSHHHHSPSFKPKLISEEREFAIGDQIIFSRNDYGLNVRNGQLAKIMDIQEELITVQKEDQSSLTFDMGNYNHIDHGYATTIHKSQGTTVDKTFMYASLSLNKHLTYVALTRHKEDVQVYVDTNIIPTKEDLFQALSKEAPKENALDYILDKNQMMDITPEDQRAFMQRRDVSASSIPSLSSYLSWESIKEFTYKTLSQAKDWMFGDLGQKENLENANLSSPLSSLPSSPLSADLPPVEKSSLEKMNTLPEISLTNKQLSIINETINHYDLEIPESLSNKQYVNLVAHTFSYLKSMDSQKMNSNEAKETELLIKSCYIQSHLKDVTTKLESDSYSIDKIFTIATMASHIWFKGKDHASLAFEQSYIPKAIGLEQAYQEQLPKLIENYQKTFSGLSQNQLQGLGEQVLHWFQISNEPPTKENLREVACFLLENNASLSQSNFKNLPLEKTTNELIPSLDQRSIEKSPDQSLLSSSKLDPAFEKAMTQAVERSRQEHQKQQQITLEKEHCLSLER